MEGMKKMKSKKFLICVSIVIFLVLALGVYANHLFPWVLLREFRTQPIEEGAAAPPFELKTLTGETVSLAQFKGKPLVLKFWSSI